MSASQLPNTKVVFSLRTFLRLAAVSLQTLATPSWYPYRCDNVIGGTRRTLRWKVRECWEGQDVGEKPGEISLNVVWGMLSRVLCFVCLSEYHEYKQKKTRHKLYNTVISHKQVMREGSRALSGSSRNRLCWNIPVLVTSQIWVSLSVLTAISRWTWVSRCLLKQRMMEVVSGDNWTTGAINRAKLQSDHHHQQTNIQFLQAGCPFYRPTNSVKALKGKYHIPWTCLPPTHLDVFQLYLCDH